MSKVGLVLRIVALAALAAPARGEYTDYVWADSVVGWNGGIKNFGGELMTSETSWWLTGLPDCDQNGNGYAWDAEDNDYVAGWKMPFAGDQFTVALGAPIHDGAGDDVLVVGYRGPACLASVQASADGISFTELGTIGTGTPGYLDDFWFDLGGLTDVRYIRVERATGAANSACFVDAVGAVPEPATGLLLLGLGTLSVLSRRR
ncbi:MAG: PEP-CTERM sorting domain-containing protein [Phycisphaerae bacterium]|nr:PEP-CTERM sorting domain-containing protein [Phycisphaerae bacterium]